MVLDGSVARCYASIAPARMSNAFCVGCLNEMRIGTSLDTTPIMAATRGVSPCPVIAGNRPIAGAAEPRTRCCCLPWGELGIDLVFECTGAFTDRATAEQHLHSGAGRVLFSHPAESDVDATIVYKHRDALGGHGCCFGGVVYD